MLDRNALKKHLPGVAGAVVLVLALLETAQAVLAPSRAPTDADWNAAAAAVRAQFAEGDLIVAAPAWADPVMRMHLGSLVPIAMATRLDDARYARVWEISQKGATTPEAQGTERYRARFGNLTVRRVEREPAKLKYDFVEQWRQARVSRQSPAGVVACAALPDRIQCPDIAFNWVKPAVLEFDFGLHRALYTQPVAGAAVVVEFDDVPLGRTLTVGVGLHHVWLRKAGSGHVTLNVLIGGRSIAHLTVDNRSPWQPVDLPTAAFAGQRQVVRFEITSDNAFSRHLGFAAEARE
ncbi:MAG: hypothetical protein SF187_22225 [Deltaproteobacteria bacterium]|nr:hypothetical protein [Deltaproteobacteria bacterium]